MLYKASEVFRRAIDAIIQGYLLNIPILVVEFSPFWLPNLIFGGIPKDTKTN